MGGHGVAEAVAKDDDHSGTNRTCPSIRQGRVLVLHLLNPRGGRLAAGLQKRWGYSGMVAVRRRLIIWVSTDW